MVAWADAVERVERWLLPAECMVCQHPVAGDALVCAVCQLRWRAIAPPYCARCGEPAPLELACRICADWPPGFGPVRSAVRLDPAPRRLLHRFKYQGWWRLAEAFAPALASTLRDMPSADLVPIPLARGRRRDRGYNQAECLARAVAERTGRRVDAGRLWRARETPTQTRLTPEGRRANLAEAFQGAAVRRPAVLVDDVFTTGATLCSAASALLDAGAPWVGAITFARAAPPLVEAAARMPIILNASLSEDDA